MRVQELFDRALTRIVATAHTGDRYVLVQRLMLLTGRRLDGGDDLPRDAQLGERPEAGLMLGPEVASSLVQADQRLLLDVVGVAAHEEVAAALGPGETAVARDEGLEGEAVATLEASRKFVIGNIGKGDRGHVEGSCCCYVVEVRVATRP